MNEYTNYPRHTPLRYLGTHLGVLYNALVSLKYIPCFKYRKTTNTHSQRALAIVIVLI